MFLSQVQRIGNKKNKPVLLNNTMKWQYKMTQCCEKYHESYCKKAPNISFMQHFGIFQTFFLHCTYYYISKPIDHRQFDLITMSIFIITKFSL